MAAEKKTIIYFSGCQGRGIKTRYCPETIGLPIMLSFFELIKVKSGKEIDVDLRQTQIRLERIIEMRERT